MADENKNKTPEEKNEIREKEKSKVVKKKNEDSKDLSGNAVEIYKKKYRKYHGGLGNPSFTVNDYYHANINFLTKTKVQFVLAIF